MELAQLLESAFESIVSVVWERHGPVAGIFWGLFLLFTFVGLVVGAIYLYGS